MLLNSFAIHLESPKLACMINLCSYWLANCLDSTEHWNDSRHIVVYNKGRWFKVYCYKNAQLLSPKDFERVFELILLDDSTPCKGEEQLAALTAGDRVPWAEVGDPIEKI